MFREIEKQNDEVCHGGGVCTIPAYKLEGSTSILRKDIIIVKAVCGAIMGCDFWHT